MKLKIIENILSNPTLESVLNHNKNVFETKDLRESHGFWNQKIIEYSNPVKIYELSKNTLEYNLIENDINLLKLENKIISIMYYYWPPGSYIPWHTDGQSFTNAITIYLNNKWDYKWGGLFNYIDDSEIKTIIPKNNIGVIQQGTVAHSTTISSKNSKIRKTIQIFLKDLPKETLI